MEPCATITDVKVLDGYRLELSFDDGVRGIVDLKEEIFSRSGVFQPLRNPAYFRQVLLNRELGTIVWPNQADFCPDMLHEQVVKSTAFAA
jgi:hypothetical protein